MTNPTIEELAQRPSDAEVIAVLKEGPRFTRTELAERLLLARKRIAELEAKARNLAVERDQLLIVLENVRPHLDGYVRQHVDEALKRFSHEYD